MALILSDSLQKELGAPLEGASVFYITVFNTYLSEAYDLLDGDEIKGEIWLVKDKLGEYPELRGKEITLILRRSAIFDYLFISKSDWQQHFREWGLVKPGYSLQLSLRWAIKKTTGKTVELYSKKDVTLGTLLE